MFTFDVFWGSVVDIIFGNSSSAVNNNRTRIPSRLFSLFLWLCPDLYQKWRFEEYYFKLKEAVGASPLIRERWERPRNFCVRKMFFNSQKVKSDIKTLQYYVLDSLSNSICSCIFGDKKFLQPLCRILFQDLQN